MKVKYMLHPEEYAIGEMEQFYARQAAKGWLLEKRGSWFSKFRRCQPQRLRYRVELAAPQFLDGASLPEAQVELYVDCGWSLVTKRGMVYLFCAPEDSDAPEFYSDPAQQAATLKGMRRSYWLSFVWLAVLLAFYGMMALITQRQSGDLWAELRLRWVRSPFGVLFYLAFLGSALYEICYGAARTAALYRRLKGGRPLDHDPKRRHLVHRAIIRGAAGLCAACLLLTLVQLVTIRNYDLPAASDGPYLTLSELGMEGERSEEPLNDSTNRVEVCWSPVARIWDVRECLDVQGHTVILYQDVYEVGSGEAALELAEVLKRQAVLSSEFRLMDVPGLDGAWLSGNEAVAVRDGTVWYCTLIDFGGDEDMEGLLTALAG